MLPLFGDRPLCDLRRVDIQRFVTEKRIGEVLALRWKNVDFEKSLIHFRESVYRGNLSSPKSRSSIRDIPIGPGLKKSLLERRMTAPAEAFVFASRNGTPMDSHNLLGRVLKPAGKRAGLPSISWHSFRHTHATLLSDLGESLKTAQAQLGHARLSTTAEIYTHAVPASQRAAVEKLERTIWGTKLDPNGPKSEGQEPLGSDLIQ
jgi:integrase